MSVPTVADAAERVPVRICRPDRPTVTGRLLSMPAQSSRRSSGARARVQLGSGAVLSVLVDQVQVIA